MDQDLNDINQLKKEIGARRKKYSKIGFMAVYGSMEAPKQCGVIQDNQLNPPTTLSNNVKGEEEDPPPGKNTGKNVKDCCKRYYRKRRYCCPGKRRYKAKVGSRCCVGRYNNNRINMCNRNWARISVNPFINFLRCYRKRFSKDTPPGEIAAKGRCEWRRMSCKGKQKYYEQAKRARIRGYRT